MKQKVTVTREILEHAFIEAVQKTKGSSVTVPFSGFDSIEIEVEVPEHGPEAILKSRGTILENMAHNVSRIDSLTKGNEDRITALEKKTDAMKKWLKDLQDSIDSGYHRIAQSESRIEKLEKHHHDFSTLNETQNFIQLTSIPKYFTRQS